MFTTFANIRPYLKFETLVPLIPLLFNFDASKHNFILYLDSDFIP